MSKNIENKIKKKDSNTVIILKSTAISFFLSLILLLIYCCLLSYTSIRESTMIPVTIIITMIASLIGGLTCTTKIKKNGLINTTKKIKNGLTQIGIEQRIGDNYGNNSNKFAKLGIGKDAAGMLDLAHGINMNDRNYIKDTISLDSYNDPSVASDKEYLKKKISDQFKDYNFDINKIKGYFFKSDSEPVQRLIENKDFQDMIRNHKDEIIKNGEFSAEFKKHGNTGLGQDNNFRNAIGKADFRNIYQDKEGNLLSTQISECTYGWSAEEVLLKVFKTATDRNRYFGERIVKLLEQMGDNTIEPKDVADELKELQEISVHLSDVDPMKAILNTIVEAYK